MSANISMKEITKCCGKFFWLVTEQIFFSYMESGPRGMFWTKEPQRAAPGTPRKSGFSARKRVKEWRDATFMKEQVKALEKRNFLAPADLKFVVSFPRYGRLKLELVFEQINQDRIYKGLNSSASTSIGIITHQGDINKVSIPVCTKKHFFSRHQPWGQFEGIQNYF